MVRDAGIGPIPPAALQIIRSLENGWMDNVDMSEGVSHYQVLVAEVEGSGREGGLGRAGEIWQNQKVSYWISGN